jgi:hypothetical protein
MGNRYGAADSPARAAMRPFEYTLGLTSILVSLALANIVMCFHRLMRNARRVTWDGAC